MTKENAITVKDSWTGKDTQVYVPNFDELVKNASCEEEIKAIREIEERMKSRKSIYKGFAFEIVYMSYEKAFVYNRETKKQEWVMKWQMMQHPWIRTWDGVYATKEEMIKEIEEMRR
jgi:hypothetical protein